MGQAAAPFAARAGVRRKPTQEPRDESPDDEALRQVPEPCEVQGGGQVRDEGQEVKLPDPETQKQAVRDVAVMAGADPEKAVALAVKMGLHKPDLDREGAYQLMKAVRNMGRK